MTETFRGDFPALARLIKEAWSENHQSLHYDEAFLRTSFDYPGTDTTLSPAVYQNDEIVAFVGAFPRTVALSNRTLRLQSLTFWTTSPRCKGQGLGSEVWTECLRRTRAAGYDGAVNFCFDGAPTNHMVLKCAERIGASCRRIYSAKYMAKLLRPSSGAAPPAGCIEALLNATVSAPLRRTWSPEEAAWQLAGRAGAVSAMSGDGVVTGYVIDVIDKTPLRALILDDLLWGSEDPVGLLNSLTGSVSAQMAVVPLLGYADTEPLRAAGFRQTRRVMHCYLTTWDAALQPGELSRLYLDVN